MLKHLKIAGAAVSCFLAGCALTPQTAPAAAGKTTVQASAQVLPSPLPSTIITTGDDQNVATAATELARWLEKAQGKNGGGVTFHLGIADQGEWPAQLSPFLQKLRQETATESYVTVSDQSAKRIYLIGKSANALKPAVYGYLQAVGFRWYFPGEKWIYIPTTPNLLQVPNGITTPAFTRRTMFGTGGMGPKGLPPDPDLQVARSWQEWQERNRFGGEIVPTGHAGDQILSVPANRAVFEQHPEWRAMHNGERVPMTKQFKFCHSNPAFQKWFVENRLQKLEQDLKRNPDTLGVSVDPSDGSGHCECPDCLKIGNGSISDRVFLMANLTAKAVAEKFPGKRVGINAYNQHAAVPGYPLEPNIYVQVIPYAFQRTGLSAEQLLDAWGQAKSGNMGVYDYWSITDWAHCQPVLDYDRTIPAKIRLWHKLHLDGVGLESTFSSGAIGLQAYIASRLFWNPDEDVDVLSNEFFEQMFGTAKGPMKRMLDRWGADYRLTAQEIALSYRDLQEALSLAGNNSKVQARIHDYIGYVFYLQRMLEFNQASTPQERMASALRWLQAIWGIHDSGMVQSYRMHMLINNRIIDNALKDELNKTWEWKNPRAPGWANWKALTAADLTAILEEGVKTYSILYQPEFYARGELRPLRSVTSPQPEWVTSGTRFSGGQFVIAQDNEPVPVQISIGKTSLHTEVTISRYNQNEVLSRVELGETDWTNLPIPAVPGVYQINVRPRETLSFVLRTKPEACLTALEKVEVRQPVSTTTFYVAPGQRNVVLHLPGRPAKTPLQVFDGDTKPVKLNEGVLKVIPVPPGQDGKVWSIRGYAGNRAQPITFINGVRVYGFSRAGMLVPVNPTAGTQPPLPSADNTTEDTDNE